MVLALDLCNPVETLISCTRTSKTLKLKPGIEEEIDEINKLINQNEKEESLMIIYSNITTKRSIVDRIEKISSKSLKIKRFNFIRKEALVLYARGIDTGIVIEMWPESITIVPVSIGCVLEHCVTVIPVGKNHMFQFLNKLMYTRGYSLSLEKEEEISDKIEKNFFVSNNYELDLSIVKKTTACAIPINLKTFLGERKIIIDQERFLVPEIIFKPFLVEIEGFGIVEAIYKSIKKVMIDLRKNMLKSMVVVGFLGKIDGFLERLRDNLSNLILERVYQNDKVRFQDLDISISKQDTSEYLIGADILYKTCSNLPDQWYYFKNWEIDKKNAVFNIN